MFQLYSLHQGCPKALKIQSKLGQIEKNNKNQVKFTISNQQAPSGRQLLMKVATPQPNETIFLDLKKNKVLQRSEKFADKNTLSLRTAPEDDNLLLLSVAILASTVENG